MTTYFTVGDIDRGVIQQFSLPH